MKCFNCDNDDVKTFFVEEIECLKCGEIAKMSYHYCSNCNTMWKEYNGIPLIGVDAELLGDDMVDVLKSLYFIEEQEEEHDIASSMEDYVDRCIRCNSICYEVSEGVYKCSNSDCGFEWEVIKCG